jgi:hypothetical protein
MLNHSSSLKVHELLHLKQSQLEIACLEIGTSSLLKIHELFYLK